MFLNFGIALCRYINCTFVWLHVAYPILGEVVVSGSARGRALSDACAYAAVFFLVCWTAFKVGCPCFVLLCGFYIFSSFVVLRSWWCALRVSVVVVCRANEL